MNLTVVSSGGLSGGTKTLFVAYDGRWTIGDSHGAATKSGTLTAAQSAELRSRLTDPAFIAESKAPPTGVTCLDGITYQFADGDLVFSADGCRLTPHVSSLIQFLRTSTTF